MTDPYSVLGITPGADDETIKKAYRQKCKQYHPDLHPDDPSAEEHFKEVQAAYSEIMRIKQGGGAAYRQKPILRPERVRPAVPGPLQRGRVRLWAVRVRVLQHKRFNRGAELRQHRRRPRAACGGKLHPQRLL